MRFLFLSVLSFVFLKSSAQSVTEHRDLGKFSAISVSGGYDKLVLKKGSSESIDIEAEAGEAVKVLTEIDGNRLKVKMKKGTYSDMKIALVITYVQLEELDNSGSTDVFFEQSIRGKEFAVTFSGSGDLHGSFDVEELDIVISGSSNMHLKGAASDQDYVISGSGDVDAGNLRGDSAEVVISGSGDVKLNVSGKVRTSVSGSGNVTNNH